MSLHQKVILFDFLLFDSLLHLNIRLKELIGFNKILKEHSFQVDLIKKRLDHEGLDIFCL